MIKNIETIYIILGIAIIVLLAIAGFFIISLETAAPSNANLEKNENVNKALSNSNKSGIQGAEDSKNNNSNSASAANGVNSPPPPETTADNENKSTVVNANKSAGPSTKTFTVTAKSWDFEPKTIKVKKGDKVVLNIKATDVAHGFMIPEFNIDEMLLAGKTTKVEFTASKSGTFTFSCSWICGEGHSKMTGQLIVE